MVLFMKPFLSQSASSMTFYVKEIWLPIRKFFRNLHMHYSTEFLHSLLEMYLYYLNTLWIHSVRKKWIVFKNSQSKVSFKHIKLNVITFSYSFSSKLYFCLGTKFRIQMDSQQKLTIICQLIKYIISTVLAVVSIMISKEVLNTETGNLFTWFWQV